MLLIDQVLILSQSSEQSCEHDTRTCDKERHTERHQAFLLHV